MSRTIRVPLFPLGGAILFPRSQLPLHIFEPRYRSMVSDAVAGPGRIAMIQPLRDDDDNRAPLHAVGCLGEIGGIEELDDGRFNIVLVGHQPLPAGRGSAARGALPGGRSRHRRVR